MKNILTLAIVGWILWTGILKLAEFTHANRTQISRVCADMRGMPLAVHARTVEANNVINWAAK